ncbi:D-alanyl-D-alanine carboxypeptidase family protein [Parvularcula dongshanensis]|uniref:D-alanyl-D-alanine carboxypeptidase n=1 Tax=Parvularcula dongshanensis TaxID=1173995 RepID=A0A840I4I3_9PROT|nr:D-alanyl-D-alanine carboxypeptidase family protein [Parvularcula dongshanensis]MBB4659245.1 D-alanyl-D-alanine carboxypeptidase [Parvularcula dongshanensis]
MAVRRTLRAFILGLIIALGAILPTAASANSKYAALVVHADTGDVLFDRYSDEARYPASLTKMMTVYLLFEALEEGEVSLDDKLEVSKRASLQPASKLGLSRGSTITVEEAIEALVIKSANDAATVVAEHLAGSESKFAGEMTAKARELGMRRTTFRNASGLPDSRQVTTANDMAVLSRRLIQDFPDRFHYFQQKSFEWNGRTYRSHNRVMLTLDGADGMKTGYTRASGYNLSTTIERDGNRLIGIVLGGRSSATRDRHMKDILNAAYVELKRKPDLLNPILLAAPTPRLKPGVAAAAIAVAAIEEEAQPIVVASLETPSVAADLNLESLKVAIDSVANDDRALDEAVIGEGDAEPADMRDWVVQVGAYTRQSQAMERIKAVQQIAYTVQPNVGREVNIAPRRGADVYRARFTTLTAYEAEAFCGTLKKKGEDCIALRSEPAN